MRELAALLEVNHGHVGRMEKGEKIPNLAMLIKIADVFHVSLDQLARDELELD